MHMIASRSPLLSAIAHQADNARGTNACTCICMCACMANLTLRDTF